MITVNSKIYPGVIARPQINVQLHENENMVFISSCWGEPNSISNTPVPSIDQESTQPSVKGYTDPDHKKVLSVIEKMNSDLFLNFNKTSYTSASEVLILHLAHNKLTWAQVGQPSMYLVRANKLIPLANSKDLSVEFSQSTPLPSNLLGISKSISLNAFDFHLEAEDIIFLYYGIALPEKVFNLKQFNLDSIFELLVKENPQQSFWISQIQRDRN